MKKALVISLVVVLALSLLLACTACAAIALADSDKVQERLEENGYGVAFLGDRELSKYLDEEDRDGVKEMLLGTKINLSGVKINGVIWFKSVSDAKSFMGEDGSEKSDKDEFKYLQRFGSTVAFATSEAALNDLLGKK